MVHTALLELARHRCPSRGRHPRRQAGSLRGRRAWHRIQHNQYWTSSILLLYFF